jgi:hypothetical protein
MAAKRAAKAAKEAEEAKRNEKIRRKSGKEDVRLLQIESTGSPN